MAARSPAASSVGVFSTGGSGVSVDVSPGFSGGDWTCARRRVLAAGDSTLTASKMPS